MKTILIPVVALLIFAPALVHAETIHVPGDYPTIQQAVDASADGDTILVADGTWEGAAINNRERILQSENGPQLCIISHTGVGLNIGVSSLVTVDGFTITGEGVGINISGSASIINCLVTYNSEGGIQCGSSNTTISNCEISWNVNDNEFGGGGIHAWDDIAVDNCLFHHNAAWSDNPGVHGQGGAIWCTFSSPTITNCTFYYNYAANVGGAIATSQDHVPAAGKAAGNRGGDVMIVENCIFWSNQADGAKEIYSWDTTLEISYSTVEGGQIWVSGYYTWGDGMIEDDPLFVTGNLGDYFLSQTASGQPADSPCVNTGNPATPLFEGTTRTDLVPDRDIIDMGWHYKMKSPEPEDTFLVAGPGAAVSNPPLVRVFPPEQSAAHTAEFAAYGADSFGVNVTTGDINGDGIDSIITGAGPGDIYGPHVRGFTSAGEAIPEINFLAYGTLKFGVNVVCGDLTGSGRDEIITGAGPGAVFGPHVRAFTNTGTAIESMPKVNFFAYGTPKWGVNVAAGDIDGDGMVEIVTGPGPGDIYGPHVRGWNVDGGAAAAIPGVSYFAYGTFKKGVRVTCGDVDGDGIDEIVTGPGPSGVFGAHVRGWNYDGGTLAEIPGINFFAWPAEESLYGAIVCSGADLDGDGRDEILIGQGPDPAAGTVVQVFGYDGSQTTLLFDLDAYGDSGLTHGVNVAAGSH